MAGNETGTEEGVYEVSDHRDEPFRAGDGDILALLYEKVVTGNGDDSLIRKNDRLEGRMNALESNLASSRQDLKDVKKMFWALILLVVTSLAVGITTLATRPVAAYPITHSQAY